MTFAASSTAGFAQQSLGLFEGSADVGNPAIPGSTFYDPALQTYTIGGSGANMWFDRDEFHFLWARLSGDFILTARASFVGEGVDPHRKLGWMIRSSLAGNAAYVDATVHGDGLTSLQYRKTDGANTEEITAAISSPDVIQLERRGNRYVMSTARFGQPFASEELTGVDVGDSVLVGLFVCSHNPEVLEEAVFDNVRITVPPPAGWIPYSDYIGSLLEIVDVESGRREVLLRSNESLQAPNWTPDGRALLYNSNGLLYRFDLHDHTIEQVDTGFATNNNNDHVLSFDGKTLGISHHGEDGGSRVYVLPANGGTPELVTPRAPSYLHGWSPDGAWLTYTAERDGDYDIYKIPSVGGDEVRLTTSEGLDDGSEYAPDGRHIYFNSARSGRMELWRMRADGSEQEQLTEDEFNNWFPHLSPDGRTIVFLSFQSDVDPSDHPFYRQVFLRMMPVGGGEPRVIAYVYGGQGTINVPSWAPDGRKIAFVSNTDYLANEQQGDR